MLIWVFILMLIWWATWLGGRSRLISIEGIDLTSQIRFRGRSGIVDRHVSF